MLSHTRQSCETITSVSAGHIILTPTQPVGSGQPQRGSNPGPTHQELRALPTELPSPPPPPRRTTELVSDLRHSTSRRCRTVLQFVMDLAFTRLSVGCYTVQCCWGTEKKKQQQHSTRPRIFSFLSLSCSILEKVDAWIRYLSGSAYISLTFIGLLLSKKIG